MGIVRLEKPPKSPKDLKRISNYISHIIQQKPTCGIVKHFLYTEGHSVEDFRIMGIVRLEKPPKSPKDLKRISNYISHIIQQKPTCGIVKHFLYTEGHSVEDFRIMGIVRLEKPPKSPKDLKRISNYISHIIQQKPTCGIVKHFLYTEGHSAEDFRIMGIVRLEKPPKSPKDLKKTLKEFEGY